MEKKNNLVMEKGNFIHGKPKKIRIVEILEIETEITDDSILMPKRTIKEFWTLDNQYIGRIDPLDNYLAVEGAIKESASCTFNSQEIK